MSPPRCLCLLPLLFLCACQEESIQPGAVARVDDEVLTETDLETSLPVGLDGETALAQRSQLIEQWIDRELLYQEALQRKLQERPGTARLLEQARRDLLMAALIDEEFGGQEIEVDEAAIEAYYQEHVSEFQRTRPEIRARHILLASQRDANAKRRALQQGAEFGALASKYSLDPDTRFQEGDLGYFSEDKDPILWEACQELQIDRVSKPVRTEYGYHLIQVLDRQEAGTVRQLEQVRDRVIEELVRQRHQERLDKLIARLKESHTWSIIAEAPTAETPADSLR